MEYHRQERKERKERDGKKKEPHRLVLVKCIISFTGERVGEQK